MTVVRIGGVRYVWRRGGRWYVEMRPGVWLCAAFRRLGEAVSYVEQRAARAAGKEER